MSRGIIPKWKTRLVTITFPGIIKVEKQRGKPKTKCYLLSNYHTIEEPKLPWWIKSKVFCVALVPKENKRVTPVTFALGNREARREFVRMLLMTKLVPFSSANMSTMTTPPHAFHDEALRDTQVSYQSDEGNSHSDSEEAWSGGEEDDLLTEIGILPARRVCRDFETGSPEFEDDSQITNVYDDNDSGQHDLFADSIGGKSEKSVFEDSVGVNVDLPTPTSCKNSDGHQDTISISREEEELSCHHSEEVIEYECNFEDYIIIELHRTSVTDSDLGTTSQGAERKGIFFNPKTKLSKFFGLLRRFSNFLITCLLRKTSAFKSKQSEKTHDG
ncbi:uncharacterized protein [Ptychodera flava]